MGQDKKELLGNILVEAGIIKAEQLKNVIEIQEETPYKLFGEIPIAVESDQGGRDAWRSSEHAGQTNEAVWTVVLW